MKQINAMIQSNNSPHLLAGGLNSLDASDYSSERWMNIVKYYEDIGKPTPRIEVTRFLKGKGYSDAKEFSGECEPVVMIAIGQNVQGTCKYGTRVDYILASPDSVYKFVPGSYSVISSKGTSDHHIVKVEITNSSGRCQESSSLKSRKTKQKVIRFSGPCSASEADLDRDSNMKLVVLDLLSVTSLFQAYKYLNMVVVVGLESGNNDGDMHF
ncbi:hypothetical protein K2173_022469 [Erythroxylum novogranatense]|uniref:Uncharacterized protein n=1 Tax=Erythroxylum novogranatense TaxID=1862640 RepID=A0AAV8TK58_9ROSI|nr:hypothetical protein K2173_022469 [Erythroxylum novogranatense]